jgi:hypothetical protein
MGTSGPVGGRGGWGSFGDHTQCAIMHDLRRRAPEVDAGVLRAWAAGAGGVPYQPSESRAVGIRVTKLQTESLGSTVGSGTCHGCSRYLVTEVDRGCHVV